MENRKYEFDLVFQIKNSINSFKLGASSFTYPRS